MPKNPDGDAYKRRRLVRAAKAAASKAKVAEERAAGAEKKVAEAEEKADKAGSRVAKLILNHTSHAKQKHRLDKQSIVRPTRPWKRCGRFLTKASLQRACQAKVVRL